MKIKGNDIRKVALRMIYEASSGHPGGSFSIADILAVLYNCYDLVSGANDKLILSKGHAAPALYAALHLLGVISESELATFRQIDSRLQGHPDKERLSNVVATTGSLGQGLSIAIGHAIAHQLQKKSDRVFCITGDGEMQEGQVWEAIMLAPKLGLKNLCLIVDANGAQNDGLVQDILPLDQGLSLAEKIRSFGWDVQTLDGHNEKAIQKALAIKSNLPVCIVAQSTKGKGVSFMESFEWHAKAPNKDQYQQALEELG